MNALYIIFEGKKCYTKSFNDWTVIKVSNAKTRKQDETLKLNRILKSLAEREKN